jgi:hypothetical protein
MDRRLCPAETGPEPDAGSPLLAAHPLAILRPESLVLARSLDACFLHLSEMRRGLAAARRLPLLAQNRLQG